jgi:hypothetical protein
MKLKDALDKIAALEKRIEELEKRPQTIINNYPTPAPVPVPYIEPYNPPYHPYQPIWIGPTCTTAREVVFSNVAIATEGDSFRS